jgi:hypothetical protein
MVLQALPRHYRDAFSFGVGLVLLELTQDLTKPRSKKSGRKGERERSKAVICNRWFRMSADAVTSCTASFFKCINGIFTIICTAVNSTFPHRLSPVVFHCLKMCNKVVVDCVRHDSSPPYICFDMTRFWPISRISRPWSDLQNNVHTIAHLVICLTKQLLSARCIGRSPSPITSGAGECP